jgi:molybdopterin-guanine dinucleotide biosynthesis protein A
MELRLSKDHVPLAGLVLCGGAGRRMGGNKALLEFEGEPLVLRVARRLAGAADPVFLASGVPGGRFAAFGYEEVADQIPNGGPLSGLVAGLAASPHPLMAVVGADMPFTSPTLLTLLAGLLEEGQHAAVPLTESRPQPLHAVYSTTGLPILRSALAGGRLALREALGELDVRTVAESEWRPADPSGRFAFNINRPEDLLGAEQAFSDRPTASTTKEESR